MWLMQLLLLLSWLQNKNAKPYQSFGLHLVLKLPSSSHNLSSDCFSSVDLNSLPIQTWPILKYTVFHSC